MYAYLKNHEVRMKIAGISQEAAVGSEGEDRGRRRR
jgi:hypothetical protein